jgi:hypothetical protein
MKRPSRQIIVGLGIFLLSGFLLVVGTQNIAAGTSLSDADIQKIQSTCQSMKTTLNQLDVSDALLRVNRGQFYESLASKLMDPFNGRLASNNIEVINFLSITNRYRSTLNSFRTDYSSYEQQLSNAMNTDCNKSPQAFYDAVQSARDKRNTVHSDVASINQAITDYQTAVSSFADTYKNATNGGSK